MSSPEDNNERQQIHEHESIALPVAPPSQRASQPPAEPATFVAQEAR